ncbi:oligosaccharide flippase family protein [Caulobacter hibisci]|uniref:Oligosaccharide flippase family protein n=1 Tax=Caulobacter hibisci TaxID=2035993 RepID=A0ABS0T549_9CAUL|nr:oligosaccharide flippase family protein [Caulobacter hibisci]MBI1687010.1 oligosaccharide flippase family protein [Caulobacter hibisci]
MSPPPEQQTQAISAPPEAAAPSPTKKRASFGFEAFTIAVARVAIRLTGFLSSLIVARVLGAEGRGLIAALSVPTSLATTFSELGIRQATAFYLGKRVYTVEQLLPTLLTLIPLAGVVGSVASIAYFEWAHVAEDQWLIRFLALITIPLALVASYSTGVFLGRERISEYRKASWRPPVLKLAILVVFAWMLNGGLYGVMIAGVVGSMLAAGYALFLLRKEGPLRFGFNPEIAKQLQRKGLSYALSLLVLMLNYRIMLILLTRYASLETVGIYSQAVLIAELLWEVPNSLSSLVLSRGVNSKDEREFSLKVVALTRVSFLAATLGSICLAIVSPFAFPILFGQDFADSALLCVYMLPGVVAFGAFKMLNIDIAGRGKPWATQVIMVPVLALNVALGWWMVVKYGAAGAAWCSSICYIVATVAYVGLYSRLTGLKLREIILFRKSDFLMVLRSLPFKLPFLKFT